MTCLCINSGPEHLESFPLTLSVTLIDVLFSMSILTSSSVFWDNFISTVLPVILQKRSFPGMPSPIGKTGILCYLSLCIFLWLVVGLEQFFSWDGRTLGCDEISLGYLPTIGKKKPATTAWLAPIAASTDMFERICLFRNVSHLKYVRRSLSALYTWPTSGSSGLTTTRPGSMEL